MRCESISTSQVDYYVNNSQAVIIDLRNNEEYNKIHIKNAINIPFEEMEQKLLYTQGNNIELNNKYYGKNTIFVVYCDRGSKSMMVCPKLAAKGYQVKTVVGGISQYHGKYIEQYQK